MYDRTNYDEGRCINEKRTGRSELDTILPKRRMGVGLLCVGVYDEGMGKDTSIPSGQFPGPSVLLISYSELRPR